MEKSRRKNCEKLFFLKVCLPIAYEEIGDVVIEAVERGWAVEEDLNFINNIVGRYVNKAKEEIISYKGEADEKINLTRQFNYFLYSYLERRDPKTIEEVDRIVEEYYEVFQEAVELGGKYE